jgi:hypothetical protein
MNNCEKLSLSEEDAIAEVLNIWRHYQRPSRQYLCTSCHGWHVRDETSLDVTSDNSPSSYSKCEKCVSGDRRKKIAYPFYLDAKEAGIAFLTRDKGLFHRVYPCPLGNGWHLTKKDSSYFKESRKDSKVRADAKAMLENLNRSKAASDSRRKTLNLRAAVAGTQSSRPLLEASTDEYQPSIHVDDGSVKIGDVVTTSNNVGAQRVGSHENFVEPKTLLFRRVVKKNIISEPSTKNRNVSSPTLSRGSKKVTEDIARTGLPYVLSDEEKVRVTRLIEHGKNLQVPSSFIDSREELLAWSRLKKPNSIEAYFLAGFRKVPHRTAEFTDDTLTLKLSEWIRWAQTLTDV